MDEDTADDDEVFGIPLGDHAVGHAVSNSLGDRSLGGSEHLHRLLRSLDRDLRDHDRGRLDGDIRRQHREEVGVTLALPGQRVGKGRTHRTILAADQQIDVGDLVALTVERLTNKHRHLCLLVK